MEKLIKDPIAVITIGVILLVMLVGIFAPLVASHDPLEQDILNKYSGATWEHPFGTDNLGRCIYSRVVYGVRTTVFLSLLTMACTIIIGTLLGFISGFFKGIVDEVIMRICDIMLSFPSQVMILAIVGILGVGIENVIIANIAIKWAWYARMIRGIVVKYRHKNYLLYSTAIGSSKSFIMFRHLLPNVFDEIVILATLDMGWVIISISTLSFLGLGVQPPTPEWGAMLSEAKNVMLTNPMQMLPPGLAILILVACFNLLGDSVRDIFDPKEANR